jgi:lysine-N-methylase
MSDRAEKPTLPLRALPIVEQWSCQGCGICCRGSIIPLSDDDLAKLAAQRWDQHEQFRGVRITEREALVGGGRVLAKRADGSCIFLTDAGRCTIHELHGAEEKPGVCRMFPLQLVPLEKFAYLTPRRSCPTAAADEGPPIEQQLAEAKRSGLFRRPASRPPLLVAGVRRDWPDWLKAAEALGRIVGDTRLPLVRRLVHGLHFCTLLENCQLQQVDDANYRELIDLLERGAAGVAGQYFTERAPPAKAAASLFRQAAAHYLRVHPGFRATNSWRERWRIMWMSLAFTRGRGQVPPIHPEFPPATFDALERPLGPLPADVMRPLDRFFETHTASQQYAVVGAGGRSLVENFRALALSFPLALWMLRLAIGERPPTQTDIVNIVVALERGRGMPAISRSATVMSGTHDLERLIAWYAR